MLVTPPLDPGDPKSEILDKSSLFPLLVLMSRSGGGQTPRGHQVLADLLSRLDPKFFQRLLASPTDVIPAHSILFKKIYLCIMDYVRDVLSEDWSEIPLPDFSKAAMGDVAELNRFLLLVTLVLTSKAALRMEFEGLLGHLKGDSDCIKNELQMMQKVRRKIKQLSHEAVAIKPTSDLVACTHADDFSPDYKAEYYSLQLLYEAISQEADVLRDQLTLSEREKAASNQVAEQLKTEAYELRQELTILREDKERAVTQWYIPATSSQNSHPRSNDLVLSSTRTQTELSNYLSEVNHVLDQIRSLTNPAVKISEIPTQLEIMIKGQSELQEMSAKLEDELLQARHTISGLRAANESLQSLLKETECRVISIVSEEQKRHEGLSLKLQELVQKNEKLQLSCNALVLEREDTNSRLQKAIEDKDECLKRIQQLETALNSAERSKDDALLAQQAEHQESGQMLDAQIAYWQRQYQETASLLQSMEIGFQETSAEVERLKNELALEITQKAQVTEQNGKLVSRTVNMKSQLRDLKVSLKAARLESQEAVTKGLADSETIDQLKASLRSTELANTKLHDEVRELGKQIGCLRDTLRSLRDEYTREHMKLDEQLYNSHHELARLRELNVHHQEEIGLLQECLKKEQDQSSTGEQQRRAEFDKLATQSSKLEGEVEKLLEELAHERQNSEGLRDLLEAAHFDIQDFRDQLTIRSDEALRVEQRLLEEQRMRNSLEQSVCQAKILEQDRCQKWAGKLSHLIKEVIQTKECISYIAAMASHPASVIGVEGLTSIRALLKGCQKYDKSAETDAEYVSEVAAIEAKVEQAKRLMKEEHDSMLTYIHQLGREFYQQSFFALD